MSQIDQPALTAASIATPASGVVSAFNDPTTKRRGWKDDTGFVSNYRNNFSTTSQAPAASTRTYITGSAIAVGTQKLQIGSMFRWRFNITKTGAGTATSTIDIAVGTAGTTADTARVSFTKPAGTAVIDEGFVEIDCICRGPLSASGIFTAEIQVSHNLATTGHMAQQVFIASVQSSGFDVTVANLFVGLCITTGASDAITIQQIQTEAWNV